MKGRPEFWQEFVYGTVDASQTKTNKQPFTIMNYDNLSYSASLVPSLQVLSSPPQLLECLSRDELYNVIVIILGSTNAGASLSTRHLLLELLSKPPLKLLREQISNYIAQCLASLGSQFFKTRTTLKSVTYGDKQWWSFKEISEGGGGKLQNDMILFLEYQSTTTR